MKRVQHGFNLIEILFALLLLGLVVSVSLTASSTDVAGFSHQRDSTLARWVALNQIAMVQTGKPEFPPVGSTKGEVQMGRQTWQWQQEIVPVPNELHLRKVKVTVFPVGKPQKVMALEVGYVADPAPRLRNSGAAAP